MEYDYFYEGQLERFTFFRIPKMLITEEKYKDLSTVAKVLYGLLLDRVSLSKKFGWIDKNGRVYVIFTNKSVVSALGCNKNTVTSKFLELENYGLIERKRQGQGKPIIIYVKNLSRPTNTRTMTPIFWDSRLPKNGIQESHFLRCNNTKSNNTNINKTNLILSDDDMDERETYKQYFVNKMEYQVLKEQYPYQSKELDEILELLVDTVSSKKKSIRIDGDTKSLVVVKNQFMKLEYCHMQYVMDCMKKKSTEVHNIKQYLLTTLYNAPLTMNNYYTAMYNCDRANGRI